MGSATRRSDYRTAKTAENTLLDTLKDALTGFAVPIGLIAIAARYLWKRRQAQAKAQPKTEAPASKPERKPRRDYKVSRDAEHETLLGGGAGQRVEVDPGDNQMVVYNEDEVDAAGGAAAGGAGNQNMLAMLQQMGFKVMMPKDGSGQVFLVPPGEEGGEGAEAMMGVNPDVVYEDEDEGEDYDEDEDA